MNFFNFTNLSFLVLLAVLIVTAGILYWKSRKNKKASAQREPQFTLAIRNPYGESLRTPKSVMQPRQRAPKAPKRKKKNHSVALAQKQRKMLALQKRALWIEIFGDVAVCYVATNIYFAQAIQLRQIFIYNKGEYLKAKTKPSWINRYKVSEGLVDRDNSDEYALSIMDEKGHRIPHRILYSLKTGPVSQFTQRYRLA